MNMNFLMKEMKIQQKERDEQRKVKQTEDRINKALKNTRKDKQALLRRRAELREMDELVKSLKKSQRSNTGISKELRPKISLEYTYVPNDKQTIADPQVLDKNKPKGKRPKKTFQEFMAQEIPKSENSLDKQIVSMKDTLKKLNNS
jgi:hypothetical protein